MNEESPKDGHIMRVRPEAESDCKCNMTGGSQEENTAEFQGWGTEEEGLLSTESVFPEAWSVRT